MSRQADYTYTRKDGGIILCYGDGTLIDTNFDIVCEDELRDGIYADGNPDDLNGFPHWRDVCRHLEYSYCSTIEQIIAC